MMRPWAGLRRQVGRRLDAAELGAVAGRELAIRLAAVASTAMLVLGAVGLLRGSTAGWPATSIGVATLVVQGFRYAWSSASAAWAR
jgi:hypothetical protein